MIRLRVSNLDAWVRFKEPEREEYDVSVEDFIAQLKRESEPNDTMRAGTAFHSVLEGLKAGDELGADGIEVDGFTFRITADEAIHLPDTRECETPERIFHTWVGPVSLQGRLDGWDGFTVYDHKLTGKFDAERYGDSMQWRAYLLLTGARRFRYYVYEQKTKDRDVTIHDIHTLTFWAYPEMEEDVSRRVCELTEFIDLHVPELNADALEATDRGTT